MAKKHLGEPQTFVTADIERFARRDVGLCPAVDEFALVTDDFGDVFRQLEDDEIFTSGNVNLLLVSTAA